MRREKKKKKRTGTRLKEAFWHREKNVAFYLHRLHSDIFQALSPPSIFFPLAFSVFPLFLVESSSYVALYLFPPFLFYFYFFAYLRFFTPTDVYVAMLSTMNAKNETTLLHRFCLWSPYLLLSGDSFFFLFTSFLRLFVDICHRLWMHVRAQSDIFIYYSSEIEKKSLKKREIEKRIPIILTRAFLFLTAV